MKLISPRWSACTKKMFLFALCSVLCVFCASAGAQKPKKLLRIGYLSSIDPAHEASRAEGIRLALHALGYIEGQTVQFDYRYSEGKSDRASEQAAELVRLKPDIIIVAGGFYWIRAAKDATKTIPIVMVGAGNDPVAMGLIESLARPGGNVSGMTNLVARLGGKRLELLKEAVPQATHVAVIYEPATPANISEVKKELPSAAVGLKMSVKAWDLGAAGGVEHVFGSLRKERPDALYVAGSPLVNANQKRIVAFALTSRLPTTHDSGEAVSDGGLMSYGAELADNYRRVAGYVDKILKGAKPADLPVEQPTKFELVINLKTAKQIGLTIPNKVLARADRVIR